MMDRSVYLRRAERALDSRHQLHLYRSDPYQHSNAIHHRSRNLITARKSKLDQRFMPERIRGKQNDFLSYLYPPPTLSPLLRRTTEFLLELSRTHHLLSCMYVVTSQTRQTFRLFGETVYQVLYMSLEKRFVSRVASFGKWTVPFANSTLW